MQSIPFATDDVHGGFSEGRGAVRVEDDEIILEVQVKLLGMIDRGVQTFRFDLTDLESVEHSRNMVRDCVTLRTRPMDIITRVPGSSEGRLRLKFKRRYRRAVDTLIDKLDLWLIQ